MSIDINVPLSVVRQSARVANALSELMLALGEVNQSGAIKGAPSNLTAPKVQPEPEDGLIDPIEAEKIYRAWLKTVPERTEEFYVLIEKKGRQNIHEVKEAMGISQPKALGGITGSANRWLPERGIPKAQIPVLAGKDKKGDRYWRWVGFGDETPAPVPAPKARRSTKRRRSASKATAPKVGKKGEGLEKAMKGLSRTFLETLKRRGEATKTEMCEALGLTDERQLGGTVGAIGRKASDLGVEKPYRARKKPDGERFWLWGAESSATEADVEPITGSVRKRKRGEKGTGEELAVTKQASNGGDR